MVKKAFCEGSTKNLLWLIAGLTIVILAATYYFHGEDKLADPSNAIVAMPPNRDAKLAAGVDGITTATPKGGFKLINQMPAQQLAVANRQAATDLMQPTALANIEELLNNVAATIKPAVAHIEVVRPDPRGVGNGRVESIGSGVIIDRRGYILTNYHVLHDAIRIKAIIHTAAGSKTYDATLIQSDAMGDLAIIKIDATVDFPVARLGDAKTLNVGDWVLAVGSPLDLAQTVSLGIVSALRETVRINGIDYTDMIQTDAHINKGNSGGPLVNIHGEVIGINTAIYTPNGNFTGVGFALPIERSNALLNSLNIAPHRFTATVAALTKQQMTVLKSGSWLGIEGVTVTPEIATKFELATPNGIYVTNIFVDSPGHQAGLRQGDILIWINSSKTHTLDEMRRELARTPPGQTITLRICRGNRVYDLSAVTTAKW